MKNAVPTFTTLTFVQDLLPSGSHKWVRDHVVGVFTRKLARARCREGIAHMLHRISRGKPGGGYGVFRTRWESLRDVRRAQIRKAVASK